MIIMAYNTNISLRNQLIYEVYVRNHGQNGTFQDVIQDLDRIKELGTDIVWFMPIHPIGQKNKKGDLGCPYSIEDYRKVSPEYGTLEDFKETINEIHRRGMKVIIDVVYSHTSHGSVLAKEHSEWFYKKPDGRFGNKVGDWSDIIDLDYRNQELWTYQIETLKYWVELGVDGFRCDAASLVPIKFWLQAREEVAKIKEDVIWLAESVDPDFMYMLRKKGVTVHSDSEVYTAFDVNYDNDVYKFFIGYLQGKNSLETYLEKVRQQQYIYPDNYIKLRCLENHDVARSKALFPVESDLRMWTAFMYFQQGLTLLYAGQEAQDDHTPSLFDIDKINWSQTNEDFTSYLKKLGQMKKDLIFSQGFYQLHEASCTGVIFASYESKQKEVIGIFNVEKKFGEMSVNLPNGIYINLINDEKIEIKDEKIVLGSTPIIFEIVKK